MTKEERKHNLMAWVAYTIIVSVILVPCIWGWYYVSVALLIGLLFSFLNNIVQLLKK